MYATKIKMQQGCENSNSTQEIAELYIEGASNSGFYTRESIHNHLLESPNSIKVNIGPYYPYVIPATSVRGVKYVRSEANDTPHDNLLKLPRV